MTHVEQSILPPKTELLIAQGLALQAMMSLPHERPSLATLEFNPPDVRDHTLRYVLRPLMLALASGKYTHWWDWHDLPADFPFEKGINLEGDPDAFPVETGPAILKPVRRIAMSLGGWKNGYIIGPEDKQAYHEGWRYAYQRLGKEDQTRRYCSLILHGPAIALAGFDDIKASCIRRNSLEEYEMITSGKITNRGRGAMIV